MSALANKVCLKPQKNKTHKKQILEAISTGSFIPFAYAGKMYTLKRGVQGWGESNKESITLVSNIKIINTKNRASSYLSTESYNKANTLEREALKKKKCKSH